MTFDVQGETISVIIEELGEGDMVRIQERPTAAVILNRSYSFICESSDEFLLVIARIMWWFYRVHGPCEFKEFIHLFQMFVLYSRWELNEEDPGGSVYLSEDAFQRN